MIGERNIKLYESKEVVYKYTENKSRTRCLNEMEKQFIDKFDIKNKKILVVGVGAGRVPANLILFGNQVLGVERSKEMIEAARKNFPEEEFKKLKWIEADGRDLSRIESGFDVVFFPQGGIDYIYPYEDRIKAVKEMAGKVRSGGLIAVASHNKRAYIASYKLPLKRRRLSFLNKGDFVYDKEEVVGGGIIYKGEPRFSIKEIEEEAGASFLGFTCSSKSRLDRLLAGRLSTAQWIFPLILYVFKKNK